MKSWIVIMAGALVVAVLVSPDLDPPKEGQAKPTHSFIDTALGASQRMSTNLGQIALAQCPADMPDCTRTARQRYEKWLRGGYGYSRAWRLHYGRSIRRAVLRMAHNEWVRKYPPRREWNRQREWRQFRRLGYDHPRVCVARLGFDYWNGDTSEYCRRRWYRDPARKFVKNVLVCAGQIALARIGTRGLARKERATIVSGTGALCGWDKMP